ncbi:MAG: cation:proton antiporter [Paracoccaceae bacterium]|jgi:multicomponent Na+:H+ antiporter subunit F|nr:cation:proton antiporter [Paracoccaceae bacterium]|tara:strand:- start:27 stop:323 length:297 start_codon:yes stop_codon:yes gene_type:complete
MIYTIAILAILIAMALVLIRLIKGPTLYDRVLAVNSFGTHTVLLIGVVGFWNGRPDFLDIALLYALINFVGTIAILKFFRYRAIGDVMWSPPQQDEER